MLYPQFMPPTVIISVTNTLVITEIMSMARQASLVEQTKFSDTCSDYPYSISLEHTCWKLSLLATISSYPLPHSSLSTTVPTHNTKYCRVNSALHSDALLLGNNSPIKNIHNATDARVNNMEDSMIAAFDGFFIGGESARFFVVHSSEGMIHLRVNHSYQTYFYPSNPSRSYTRIC
jgi:hypothetical protein